MCPLLMQRHENVTLINLPYSFLRVIDFSFDVLVEINLLELYRGSDFINQCVAILKIHVSNITLQREMLKSDGTNSGE